MNEITTRFLRACKKVNISRVAIYCKDPILNKAYTSVSISIDDLVYSNDVNYAGWPAIWAAFEFSDIQYETGGHSHCQCFNKKLEKGIYNLIDDKWISDK
jgi:hypothetical protein